MDVDLSREWRKRGQAKGSEAEAAAGRDVAARAVSRRQAFLSLQPDGSFRIENVGRCAMAVDGAPLAQFASAALAHGSLIEVGGIVALLFTVNAEAVKRCLRRTARFAL